MRRPVLVAAAACLYCLVASAIAGTNGLDSRFGTGGIALIGPTASGQHIIGVLALAIRADGEIAIAGFSEDAGGVGSRLAAIGLLKADGSWDAAFGDNGLFTLPFGVDSAPNGAKLQTIGLMSDGSVLGSGTAYADQFGSSPNSCTLLLKLTSAGALDPDFGPDHSGSFCFDFATISGATYISHYDGVAIDADDTWYLTTPTTNLSYGAVAHFDTAGSLMTSYGSNGIAALSYRVFGVQLLIQADHSLLVGSVYTSTGGQGVAVSRLDPTGNIDNQYGSVGNYAVDFQVNGAIGVASLALDAQGRSLIAINAESTEYFPYQFARVTPSGGTDTAFNGNGQQPGYPGFAMPAISAVDFDFDESVVAAQPIADGHIFAIGDVGQTSASDGATNVALLRLNEDSSFDQSFGDAAHLGWSSLHFGASGSSNAFADALSFDSNGRAFVSIVGTDTNGISCPGIIRIIPDELFVDSLESPQPAPTCPQ